MDAPFRFLIRDGLAQDIDTCLALDSTYQTDYVWQMTVTPEPEAFHLLFRTERLPRMVDLEYPLSRRRIQAALPAEHCFLVAEGRRGQDEAEIIAFLVMHHIAARSITVVQDIVVSRPFRRRGIGTRLLKVARQWADEQRAWQMTVETQTKNYPSIALCQKNGLTFCGFHDQYFPNQDIAVFFGQTLR